MEGVSGQSSPSLCASDSVQSSRVGSPATPSSTTAATDAVEDEALLYIIAVLFFYSFGIVLMIIQSLRSERRDLEQQKVLEDYLLLKHKLSWPQPEQRERTTMGGRLALSALNAANVVAQTSSGQGEKITFV